MAKLLHKKSQVEHRIPSASTLAFGEIAVNYNENDPFLSIRTSGITGDLKVATFPSSGAVAEIISSELDKIDIATPDWNAQEGEAGYIENKPFHDYIIRKIELGETNNIYSTSMSLFDNYDSVIYFKIPIYHDWDVKEYIIHEIRCVSLEGGGVQEFKITHPGGAIIVHSFADYEADGDIRFEFHNINYDNDDVIDNIFWNIGPYRNDIIKELSNLYLPNTVIKTTPQTLSDTDKNQALANLGLKGKIDKLVNINYLDLVNFRKNSQLIPGQQYRIVDYATKAKSVDKNILPTASDITVENHFFDIIVTADDIDVLNENARVLQRDGDTYFNNSNLSAWEIKYCIDNDVDRFMWADVDEGKGCIYFMKDEFDNECPYDFKNIKFKYNDTYYYTFHDVETNGDASLSNIYCYSNIIKPNNPWGKYNLNGIIFKVGLESYCYGNVFGPNCINIVIDSQGSGSFNNHFGHTCKDIVLGLDNYKNTFGDGCKNIVFDDNCYKNFIDVNGTNITFGKKCNDNTINGNVDNIIFSESCVGNTIGMRNSTIEFGKNCNVNVIEYYSKNIKMEDNCEANRLLGGENNKYLQKLKLKAGSRYNTIGLCFNNSLTDADEDSVIEGNSNAIGKLCRNVNIQGTYNVIEDNCQNITLANNSKYNTVKSQCSDISMTKSLYNTIGKNCNNIMLGLECNSNIFGNGCYSNTFGDGCNYNTFGNYCNSNIFGNYCNSNIFGDNCSSNIFGDNCSSNIFGDNCSSNTFENNCSSNIFGNNCSSNTFGYYCDYNTFGVSSYSNTFRDKCRYNTFGFSCYYNTFGEFCYSNTFGDGCNYNTFGNNCYSNIFGASKTSPKSYYRYIIFDNGNRYINLNCTSTTSSSKYYQNVRIGLGVNNTGTRKTINDANVNQAYETLYKPANSQTITI